MLNSIVRSLSHSSQNACPTLGSCGWLQPIRVGY